MSNVVSKISKTFKFDKVAYSGTRKINQPEVEMELRYDETGKPELSICADLWNGRHTDIVMGGQCLDELMQFDSLSCNALFRKLHRLWKLYHLNDMHAGTVKQEQALEEARNAGKRLCCYEDSCKYLESIGLLVDDGYKYGSSWLYREIPEDDLKLIEELING